MKRRWVENTRKIQDPPLLLLVLPVLLVALSGCGALMALSGKKAADLSALRLGQDRTEVIAILGKPARTVIVDGKKVDIFDLQRGNDPSGSRAVMHGAMDVLTFGFWEVLATPMEATQGESFTLSVEYDDNDKVTRAVRGDIQPVGEAVPIQKEKGS